MPNHAVIGVIRRRGRGRNSIEVTISPSQCRRIYRILVNIEMLRYVNGRNGKKGTDLQHRQKREPQVIASV